MKLEDYSKISEGLKSGTIVNNKLQQVVIYKNRLQSILNRSEISQEDAARIRYQISKYEELLKTVSLQIVPKAISTIDNFVSKPEILQKLSLLQYNGIVTLPGNVMLSVKNFLNVLVENPRSKAKTILRRFLEFYLQGYEVRKSNFGSIKSKTLDLDSVFITSDNELSIVMDLFCPSLLLTKNKETPFNIDIGIVLNNEGLGIRLQGSEVVHDIPVDGIDIFKDGTTVKIYPSYSTVIRNPFWVNECMIILNVVVCLILQDFGSKKAEFTNVCNQLSERLILIVNEGIALEKEKLRELIEKLYEVNYSGAVPNSEMVNDAVEVLYPLVSHTSQEFSDDVQKVLQVVINQCA